AEIMLASLQTHSCDVSDVLGRHDFSELIETPTGKYGEWLRHVGNVAEGHESATPVGQLADVLSGPASVQGFNEFGRKPQLGGRQHGSPAFGNANGGPVRREWRHQPVEDVVHGRNKIAR